MEYIFSILILCAGYYTFSYGVYLWKEDKNRLGAVGAVVAAIMGAIVPVIVLFIKF